MVEAMKEYFTRFVDFKGRTSRKTFWLTVLGLLLIQIIIGVVSGVLAFLLHIDPRTISNTVSLVWSLVTIIPSTAMDVRRLHDINKSGWLVLLALIPIVGFIILIVFCCLPSVDEGNKY